MEYRCQVPKSFNPLNFMHVPSVWKFTFEMYVSYYPLLKCCNLCNLVVSYYPLFKCASCMDLQSLQDSQSHHLISRGNAGDVCTSGPLKSTTQQLSSLSIPPETLCCPLLPLLLLLVMTSQVECREFNGERGCALPVQSAVPALFVLYHISRTSRIYMDFLPLSFLSALRGV